MDYEEEILKHIFESQILEKVKLQFSTQKLIVNANSKDENFRLLLTNSAYINLEQPIFISMSQTSNQENIRFYFKPLAVYTNDEKVYLFKEFEEKFNSMFRQNKIYSSLEVKRFSILENAVIGAFSLEMYRYALLKKDFKTIHINGLDFDIFMTSENEPQIWLDDKYGIDFPIGIYFPNQSKTIASMIQTKEIFERFDKLELLTVFKKNLPENY